MGTRLQIRPARTIETDRLAGLWHQGWLDAHETLLPAALRRHRTPDTFRRRMEHLLPHVRVAATDDDVWGFHIVQGAELYQLYVSSTRRGTGVADQLMNDAEALFRSNGIAAAWLACAIGNLRAARFYQNKGWRMVGVMVQETAVAGGTFPLEVWRFERQLPCPGAA